MSKQGPSTEEPALEEQRQKVVRIFSERQNREISLSVHYATGQRNGCKVYRLQQREELE